MTQKLTLTRSDSADELGSPAAAARGTKVSVDLLDACGLVREADLDLQRLNVKVSVQVVLCPPLATMHTALPAALAGNEVVVTERVNVVEAVNSGLAKRRGSHHALQSLIRKSLASNNPTLRQVQSQCNLTSKLFQQ